MKTKVVTSIFEKSIKNEHFKDNLYCIGYQSCLLADNFRKETNLFIVSPLPRRHTYILSNPRVDIETMKLYHDRYIIDNIMVLKKYARKKALAVGQLIDTLIETGRFYSYFITLTLPQHNRCISDFLRRYKEYLTRKGYKIVYSFWVLEFADSGKHPHYHINLTFEGIKPDSIALDFCPNRFWDTKFRLGQKLIYARTEVDNVHKSVYRYMTKYFTKNVNTYCVNHRNYGFSSLYSNLPEK